MSVVDELIRELREIANCYYGEIKNYVSTIEEAADTIESLFAKLQAANMERSADCGGWIPCSERLPEIMKPVLVCDKQGNICVRAITCKIKDKKYWSQGKNDVVAWQPLPEPCHEP